MITLVLGGTRSGKSEVAEGLLPASGPVTYVATGQVTDPDMAGASTPTAGAGPPSWTTVEAGADLVAALDRPDGPVLVDSLGTWVAAHDDLAPDVDALSPPSAPGPHGPQGRPSSSPRRWVSASTRRPRWAAASPTPSGR